MMRCVCQDRLGTATGKDVLAVCNPMLAEQADAVVCMGWCGISQCCAPSLLLHACTAPLALLSQRELARMTFVFIERVDFDNVLPDTKWCLK